MTQFADNFTITQDQVDTLNARIAQETTTMQYRALNTTELKQYVHEHPEFITCPKCEGKAYSDGTDNHLGWRVMCCTCNGHGLVTPKEEAPTMQTTTTKTKAQQDREHRNETPLPTAAELLAMKDPAHAVRQSPEAQALIDAAAEAEELFSLDELEEYAKEYNAMTPGTDNQAREIKLYAENTAELYPEYQEIERAIDAMIDAGASEEEAQAHAAEKIEPWLQRAAARYYREIGTHHYKRFSLTAIGQAAESMAEDLVDDYEYRKPYR